MKLLLLFHMIHKPVAWHCHITQHKKAFSILKFSYFFGQLLRCYESIWYWRSSICKNNQIFRERDLEKRKDSKNALLAKCILDAGESGLCSVEQDVNEPAHRGRMHFRVPHFIRRQNRNVWVMRNCTPSSASAATASLSRVHSFL